MLPALYCSRTTNPFRATDFASDVNGSGLNSTIITSLGQNSAFARGMLFDRVTFDASGAFLTGSQVREIGTTTVSGTGDGLYFINSTGDLNLSLVDITNSDGAGLEVFTKGLGTTFNLQIGSGAGSPSGSIVTTDGPALFLDPLTGSINVGTVTSTDANASGALRAPAAGAKGNTSDGMFIDEFTTTGGAFNCALRISNLNITNPARHAVRIEGSQDRFHLWACW